MAAGDFQQDLNEEYDEMRTEYYATLLEKKWFSLAKAREMKPKLTYDGQRAPNFIGNKVFENTDLSTLRRYIDWSGLFHVYQLRGKYPNRDYPQIFKDDRVGLEARKIFDEANELLDTVIAKNQTVCTGIIGIYPANSVGDDIEVYADEERGTPVIKFFGLRQQQDTDNTACYCLSDFIAPKGSTKDYIGAFACTAGLEVHKLKEEYNAKGEIDTVILLDAVTDRLAEAFAEYLHEKMRKELWGYAPDENLSFEELLKVKYTGIRPAPGYPTQPEHSEKRTLWKLLDIERLAPGISLTESFMMQPAASVCALCFANPQAQYFALGSVNKDQVVDYAARKGISVENVERYLGSTVLGYEPVEWRWRY